MTATFDTWEWSARSALAERGIGYQEATRLIEDARSHVEQSGQDPWQVLGSPQEFAADVATDQPAAQARLDTQGKTARDHLSDAVFALAFLAIPAMLLGAWAVGSWTIPVTVAGVTGAVLAGAGLLVGQAAPGALRAAGHSRLAPWGLVVCGVLVVAAGTAFTQLPRTRIGQIPVLGVLAISLALCWLLTRPGRTRNRPESTSPDDARDPDDAQAWFARLHAVLIGRFDVPADRAATLVAETSAHVAAAGTIPRQEFPSLAGYARELAEGEPVRQGPWWRSPTAHLVTRASLLLLLLPSVVQILIDGDLWIGVGGVAVVLWLAWDSLRSVQALAQSRRQGGDST